MKKSSPHHSLALMLRTLKLPTFAAMYEQVALRADREGWTLGQSLQHLCELEIEERRLRKIERILKAADLPPDKTLATLDAKRWPTKVQRQIPALCTGDFLDRAENVLVFGLPGRGKTHLCAAIGYELARRGRSVLFTTTAMIVQRLLRAKRDLVLERELDRLDAFDAVILDDIGYVQQERVTASRTPSPWRRSCRARLSDVRAYHPEHATPTPPWPSCAPAGRVRAARARR